MKRSVMRRCVLTAIATGSVLVSASLFTPQAAATKPVAQEAVAQETDMVAPMQNPMQIKSAEATAFYEETKAIFTASMGELGADYYAIYRIAERIARANGLDERPWRVQVSPTLTVNAYASDINMLTFEGGLLEQLSGDHAALACVVGHEMAHHTQQHIPTRQRVAAEVEALQRKAAEQARDEIESQAQGQRITDAIIGGIFGTIVSEALENGSLVGVFAGAIGYEVFEGLTTEQAEQASARAEEIYEERVGELNAAYSEVMHEQESEADSVGYEYMVRAGFASEGCERTMAMIGSIESSHLPSMTHPHPAERLTAIRAMNVAATNQSLVVQGEANLARSPNPLTYGIARGETALRIDSRYANGEFPE